MPGTGRPSASSTISGSESLLPRALPEGDSERPARALPLRRLGGPAADEQGLGAGPRSPSRPRASCQRSAAGLAGLVGMGSTRVNSGLATRLRPEEGLVLRPRQVRDAKDLRAELEARRESRWEQRRFRLNPGAYLKEWEHRCLQLSLPPPKKIRESLVDRPPISPRAGAGGQATRQRIVRHDHRGIGLGLSVLTAGSPHSSALGRRHRDRCRRGQPGIPRRWRRASCRFRQALLCRPVPGRRQG